MTIPTRKTDNEIIGLIIITAIFGGTLLGCDIGYSNWAGMFHTPYSMGLVFAILGHLGTIAAAVIMFWEWDDPNFDKIRYWFCALALATLIYICAFRAFFNESNSVIEDSNSVKQQQIQ